MQWQITVQMQQEHRLLCVQHQKGYQVSRQKAAKELIVALRDPPLEYLDIFDK